MVNGTFAADETPIPDVELTVNGVTEVLTGGFGYLNGKCIWPGLGARALRKDTTMRLLAPLTYEEGVIPAFGPSLIWNSDGVATMAMNAFDTGNMTFQVAPSHAYSTSDLADQQLAILQANGTGYSVNFDGASPAPIEVEFSTEPQAVGTLFFVLLAEQFFTGGVRPSHLWFDYDVPE